MPPRTWSGPKTRGVRQFWEFDTHPRPAGYATIARRIYQASRRTVASSCANDARSRLAHFLSTSSRNVGPRKIQLVGVSEIGPLMPKMAIWKTLPGRASFSSSRLGTLKPAAIGPARVARLARQLAVDPDLAVVVDRGLEEDRLALRLGRDGHLDAVPAEADLAVASRIPERLGLDDLPVAVVEVRSLGLGLVAVGPVGRTILALAVHLDDLDVVIPPLALRPRRPPPGAQVDLRGRGRRTTRLATCGGMGRVRATVVAVPRDRGGPARRGGRSCQARAEGSAWRFRRAGKSNAW